MLLLGFPLRFPVASSFFHFNLHRFRFVRYRFRILSSLFFLSALRRFRSPSGFPNALSFAFALLKFSPFTLSRFQYSPSGSAYSARCSFPFILPCFAPTAVPQVLTSASLRLLQVTFVCSLAALSLSLLCGLEPNYSALCFFLSLLLTFPSQWFLYRCFRSLSPFQAYTFCFRSPFPLIFLSSSLFPCCLPGFGTQLCCTFLSARIFRLTAATFIRRPCLHIAVLV